MATYCDAAQRGLVSTFKRNAEENPNQLDCPSCRDFGQVLGPGSHQFSEIGRCSAAVSCLFFAFTLRLGASLFPISLVQECKLRRGRLFPDIVAQSSCQQLKNFTMEEAPRPIPV